MGVFFGGAMADSGEDAELGVADVGAELDDRDGWDGAVALAPDEQCGRGERSSEQAAEDGHVVVPGAKEVEQMADGAGGAEVLAVGA